MGQRFVECLDEVGRAQHVVILELDNWKQSQRQFSWEDDSGRVELNNIQHWFESLAELLWRLRQLGKQVCNVDNNLLCNIDDNLFFF